MLSTESREARIAEVNRLIEHLSPYEINQLQQRLSALLEDPRQVSAIKQSLHVGDRVVWLHSRFHQECVATLLKMSRKYVVLQNLEDEVIWQVPYYAIKTAAVQASTAPSTHTTRQKHRVGDHVEWQHDGNTYYGTIRRLNEKTVTVYTATGTKWRIGYNHLISVIDM